MGISGTGGAGAVQRDLERVGLMGRGDAVLLSHKLGAATGLFGESGREREPC